MKANTTDGRTRNWACIFWPDSAPANFIDIISDWHVPAFLSPLHHGGADDLDNQTKDHYHLMVMFDGKASEIQANNFFKVLGGITLAQTRPLVHPVGYARYLIHLDDPDKEQFSISQVRAFCGIDYEDYIINQDDDLEALMDIIDFCEEHHIYSFRRLCLYCRYERRDWFRIIMKRQRENIWKYLKSFYNDVQSAADFNARKEIENLKKAASPLLAESSEDEK